MASLRQHVEYSIRTRKLFRRGERIVVAVSGGVDSMVLLNLLSEFAVTEKWQLFVAHFNHQLRGRASDGDERFVKQAAAKAKLPCAIERGAVQRYAKEQGMSTEMAARQLRHQVLARAARRFKCRVIVTAHHADDQVELFFLRLLRGSGSDGLVGMKWSSVSPAEKTLRIARPLLDVTKSELEQFAGTQAVKFRIDATNDSHDILRNRIRHELLPLLRRKYQPALNRVVLRTMDLVGAEAEILEEMAVRWLQDRKPSWQKLGVGLRRRLIWRQLLALGVVPDFELVETLRTALGQPVSVAAKQELMLASDGQVRFVAKPRGHLARQRKLNLKAKTNVSFGELRLSWNITRTRTIKWRDKPGNSEFFDADKVNNPIVLRYWQPGDRFRPIGMKSAVKLQDWFTNQKIPVVRRRELVIATTGDGEIFWVQGLRIGEAFKLTERTKRVLRWGWQVG